MRAHDIFLSSIGVFLPAVESIESAVERGLYRAEDVAERGLTGAAVAGDIPAPEMALRAAQEALKRSGMSPEELALLVYADVWHQGPDGWDPQYYLQRQLAGDDVLAVEIKQGCNGMLSGIELAIGYLRAEPRHQAALIVGSDNFGTRLIDRWGQGAGFSVLGDGASAVVLTRKPGFAQLRSVCTSTFSALEEVHRAGEPMFPPGVTTGQVLDFAARAEAFRRKVVAEGNGTEIMLRHQQHNLKCMNRALSEAEIDPGDIKRIITHNISQQELKAYLGVLGFSLSQSTWDYGRGIGHMGTSDYVVSLHQLLTTGQLRSGDFALLSGFSPGVTYKAAVIQILSVPEWARSPAGHDDEPNRVPEPGTSP